MEHIGSSGRVTSAAGSDGAALAQNGAQNRAGNSAQKQADGGLHDAATLELLREGAASLVVVDRHEEDPDDRAAGDPEEHQAEVTHGRIVEASTGNVDPDGDVVGSLIERLRAQVGPDHSDAIDPDQQARLTAGLLLAAPLRTVK